MDQILCGQKKKERNLVVSFPNYVSCRRKLLSQLRSGVEIAIKKTNGLYDVSEIARTRLCTSCGTCAAFCPSEAIIMKNDTFEGILVPEVDSAKCNSCGVCLKVCPGAEVNIKEFNHALFGQQPAHALFGNFVECYYGHSTNYNSKLINSVASGGIATQLLVFALQNGAIDGALVTRFCREDCLKPEGFLATTVEELVSAAGSKYCSSPTNFGLKELLRKEGRFAVVGLPCHLHAIRKAQQVFPELREKIALTIGLFCAFTISSQGVDTLLAKMKLDRDNVRKFAFRGHGWPGYLWAETLNGDSCKIPLMGLFNDYLSVFESYLFTPWRCMLCQDHFNQLADITLADAWLPEFKRSKIGLSLITARSEKGQQLIQRAIEAKVVTLRKYPFERIVRSQWSSAKFKSKHWAVRLALVKKMGNRVPSCSVADIHFSSVESFFINAARLRLANLRKNQFALSVLKAFPLWCYKAYNAIFFVLDKLF
ncbi:MAG: Coenzyme F420 hydrogenase/dehydrogenase, beta subunit C-terminal domain [Candidatus Bathyarchaeota archaeon]|nr:Coenzyme F420 hydrogenase/dehydrogenase, beta subunit C-terminal domain [Candidatus Bathyarchaeota archaeon]